MVEDGMTARRLHYYNSRWDVIFLFLAVKDVSASTHSSADGVFQLEFNDGSTWCLFVGNDETAGKFTFRFVPAEPGRPGR